MKRLLAGALILTITLMGAYLFLKIFIQPSFGPLAILIISFLGCFSLLLAITLVLFNKGNKQVIAKIWLCIVAAVMTFIITELVLSALLIQGLSPPIVRDQYRHHKLRSNTRSEFRTREYTYIQTVNNIGLRGSNIELKSARKNYRILMLGDSFTMGKGVRDDQTFSALLEKSLNRKNISVNNKKIEVLNAGVDSYSPILSFLQLTKDLKPLQPDLVILNLDMSDLIQEAAYRNEGTYTAKGEIIGVNGLRVEREKSLTIKVRDWIDNHLFITRLILFHVDKQPELTIENVVIRANPILLKHTLAADNVERKKEWQNLFDSIVKIQRYCSANGAKFLLTVYPWGHQVSDKEWVSGRSGFMPKDAKISDKSLLAIQEFSRNNNIELLNLFPVFRAYNGNSHLYFNEDMHWTEAGHKVVAQEIEQYIRATYFKH